MLFFTQTGCTPKPISAKKVKSSNICDVPLSTVKRNLLSHGFSLITDLSSVILTDQKLITFGFSENSEFPHQFYVKSIDENSSEFETRIVYHTTDNMAEKMENPLDDGATHKRIQKTLCKK